MTRMRMLVSILVLLGTTAAPLIVAEETNLPRRDRDAVLAAEREIWEAIKRSDWIAFDQKISGMTYVSPNGIAVWAPGMSKGLSGLVLTDYSWENVEARAVAPGIVLLTYKAIADQTMNGQKTPSPVYMMSLWRKQGRRWIAVSHSETPAVQSR